MSGLFGGSFAFLNPWALAGLLALPALYLLLKITPPAPRILQFPAARFLSGLTPKQNTPNHTPWWILLLRLLIAALLILALAQPVLNPSTKMQKSGDTLVIIDNGWSAAQNWSTIQNAAIEFIEDRSSNSADITIFTTAKNDDVSDHNAYTKTQAVAFVRALVPHPWEASLRPLKEIKHGGFKHIVYFSDGLEKRRFEHAEIHSG